MVSKETRKAQRIALAKHLGMKSEALAYQLQWKDFSTILYGNKGYAMFYKNEQWIVDGEYFIGE